MLSVTSSYIALLHASGHSLAQSHTAYLPPLPLAPFQYSVIGRLSSLQAITHSPTLVSSMLTTVLKAAAQQKAKELALQQVEQQVLQQVEQQAQVQAIGPSSSDAVQQCPDWLQEITNKVQTAANEGKDVARYLILKDLLHLVRTQ